MTDSGKPDDSGKVTMGALRGLIKDTVDSVVKEMTPTKDTDPSNDPKTSILPGGTGATDVVGAVQAELAKIRDAEKSQEREKTIDQTLAELKEKVTEKPPVERRRVHKFMGWGENEKS